MAWRLLIVALGCQLAACGFQLRGSWQLPYDSIYVDIPAHSEFGAQLKRTIVGTGAARLADSSADAQAIFVPTGESRERKILSYSSAGRVREVQLKYRYGFRVRDLAGKDLVPPGTVEMVRDLTYDDSQTLAKEQEEDLLWRDMLNDLTQQVMRRLGGRRPDATSPGPAPVPSPTSAAQPAATGSR
jgi:LPS-assembly lipoprotein